MEVLKRVKKVIDELLLWVIIFLFLMMFGITNLNVIMRYFFNSPIVFSVEMGRYCFVSIIFLGAIFTTREDRHIHVDFFTGMFPEKIQKIIAHWTFFNGGVFWNHHNIYVSYGNTEYFGFFIGNENSNGDSIRNYGIWMCGYCIRICY